jgi:hypothetical protein
MFGNTALALAAAALVIPYTPVVLAQDCTQFVVFDTANNVTEQSIAQSVRSAVCREESSSQRAATSAGTSLGIPVPVLDSVFNLKFGSSSSSENYSSWRKGFCSTGLSDLEGSLRALSATKTFGDNAKSVVSTCLNRTGALYGYFTPTPQRQGFTFSLQYRPMGANDYVKLESARVGPPDAVADCEPSNPFQVTPGRDLRSKTDFTCRWVRSDQDIRVSVRTSNGDQTFVLGGLRKVADPIAVGADYDAWGGVYWSNTEKVDVSVTDGPGGRLTWQFSTECCTHEFSGRKSVTDGVTIASGKMKRTNAAGCKTFYDVWDMRRLPGEGSTQLTLKLSPTPSCDVGNQGVLLRTFERLQ